MEALKVLLFMALLLCVTSQVLAQPDYNATRCNSTEERVSDQGGGTCTHICLQCTHLHLLVQNITIDDQDLREELRGDEGYRAYIYLDSKKKPTVGIGHRILRSDPEHGKPVGTKVTDERVQELFTQDLGIALEDCNVVFPNFDCLPQEAQRIIANMMFNLGRTRFIEFELFIKAVKAHNWSEAAVEMVASDWYGQVIGRTKRLVERMRNLVE